MYINAHTYIYKHIHIYTYITGLLVLAPKLFNGIMYIYKHVYADINLPYWYMQACTYIDIYLYINIHIYMYIYLYIAGLLVLAPKLFNGSMYTYKHIYADINRPY
jgi:hypothetical protein